MKIITTLMLLTLASVVSANGGQTLDTAKATDDISTIDSRSDTARLAHKSTDAFQAEGKSKRSSRLIATLVNHKPNNQAIRNINLEKACIAKHGE